MKTVQYLVFRYLTNADFFNIYKPSGTEVGGGGQSYIDFETGFVSETNWQTFFSGVPSTPRANGPSWNFQVNSVGLDSTQALTIYQRREQSFSIAGQRITSRQSNRVQAWHPHQGFPQPQDPTNRHSCPQGLAIYLVRTVSGEFWAGCFLNHPPCRDAGASSSLHSMLPGSPQKGYAGFIAPASTLYMDESDATTPFLTVMPQIPTPQPQQSTTSQVNTTQVSQPGPTPDPGKLPAAAKKKEVAKQFRSEEEITKALFEEDEADVAGTEDAREVLVKVRNRNAKSVQGLKELYHGNCQITGDKYRFLKKDGSPYCEAHHLVLLGNEGADSPYNIIIVSPLIHRMLHYADVSEIDLTLISASNTLDLTINGKGYTITWHPEHANYVKSHQQ